MYYKTNILQKSLAQCTKKKRCIIGFAQGFVGNMHKFITYYGIKCQWTRQNICMTTNGNNVNNMKEAKNVV